MKNKGTLQKWGNSIALRLTKNLLENSHLKLGDQVEIETRKSGEILIKKASKRRYTEKEILESLTAHNSHADELMPTLVGREVDF